jgi:four helix bundle protein
MQYQNSFRQLIVWQEGKKLTLVIYNITRKFPAEEKFAMVSQMRRSAYSFLANIAEGNAKNYLKDRCNFFNIARGSLIELDCFSEIAYDLKYINQEEYKNLLELVNKCAFLINHFIKSQSQNQISLRS